jgi:beta-mannosidase
MRRSIALDGTDWRVKGYLGLDGAVAAARRGEADGPGWLPATVPGSVVADLWRAGEVADPYVERNSLALEWVPQRAWLYRRTLTMPADDLPPGSRAWLRFEGVDFAAGIFVDGDFIDRHEGMFLPFELDVGDRLRVRGEHELAVIVEPAPVTEPQTGRTSRVRIDKSRMTYGWDFCPRMIHQGIWQPVTLEVCGLARIRDVWARPVIAPDLRYARVLVQIDLDLAANGPVALSAELTGLPGIDARVAGTVELEAGRRTTMLELEVRDPTMWWPNGHGASPVGRVVVRVTGLDAAPDERSVPIGFRTVELAPNEKAPEDARPYSFVVNGRQIHAKGWNWVPHDVLHGVPRPDRIDHLTRLLAHAHVNLVRVWGGGLIETPAFYEACDRRGIMVWQEFIQSSSGIEDTPSLDPAFATMMTREAEQILPLRRNHPSLVLWCGGNELQDDAGPLDDERSPALGALHEVVGRLDPDRAWLPTSPTGRVFHNRLEEIERDPAGLHDVHGPWEHQGLAGQYDLYNRSTSLLNSEFGAEGMTNRRTHEALIPDPGKRWPAGLDNPVYRHLGQWWNNLPLLQASFGGRLGDLESVRRASQRLQADGLRYAIEANRRRAPHNSGSLPWQFNEPYPFAWSTCAVDHRGDPKPAYFAVRRAYAPVAVTARLDRVARNGADCLEAEIWAWSELEPVDDGAVTAQIVDLEGSALAEAAWPVAVTTSHPVHVGTFEAMVGLPPPDLFLLDLRLFDQAGAPRAGSRYLFAGGADFGPLLDLAPADVTIDGDRDGDRWTLVLRHDGGPAAIGLIVEDDRSIGDPGWAEVDDSGVDLLPGEQFEIPVEWRDAPVEGRRLRVSAWNVEPLVLE